MARAGCAASMSSLTVCCNGQPRKSFDSAHSTNSSRRPSHYEYVGFLIFSHDVETPSVLRIVRELGERVGLHLWCHSLRHSGITVAVEQSTALGLSLTKSGPIAGTRA